MMLADFIGGWQSITGSTHVRQLQQTGFLGQIVPNRSAHFQQAMQKDAIFSLGAPTSLPMVPGPGFPLHTVIDDNP